jgi:hypothetical protein
LPVGNRHCAFADKKHALAISGAHVNPDILSGTAPMLSRLDLFTHGIAKTLMVRQRSPLLKLLKWRTLIESWCGVACHRSSGKHGAGKGLRKHTVWALQFWDATQPSVRHAIASAQACLGRTAGPARQADPCQQCSQRRRRSTHSAQIPQHLSAAVPVFHDFLGPHHSGCFAPRAPGCLVCRWRSACVQPRKGQHFVWARAQYKRQSQSTV